MRILFSMFTTLFVFNAAPCFAEVSEYDIEIVIFEDLSSRYISSEQWPRIEHTLPEQENPAATISTEPEEHKTANDTDSNTVLNITSNDTSMLDEYVKKLNASSRYKVLVHKSWRQAGLDAESAIEVAIDSRKKQDDNVLPGTPGDIDRTIPAPVENTDNSIVSSISGNVKIILGRYLHIYTDLIYRKPASYHALEPVSLSDSRFSEFQIKTHRRMRSKELHYLDHPLVGIMVMALPVDTDENQQQSQTQQELR